MALCKYCQTPTCGLGWMCQQSKHETDTSNHVKDKIEIREGLEILPGKSYTTEWDEFVEAGRRWGYTVVDDVTDEYKRALEEKTKIYDNFKRLQKKDKKKRRKQMYLYQVWLVYGGGKTPVITCAPKCVLAKNDDDAKIKSEIYKAVEKDMDSDYVTIICQQIGEVNVKAKPKEVKQV